MFTLSRVFPLTSPSRHRLLEVLSSRKVEVGDRLRQEGRDFTYSAAISTATNNYAAKGIALYKFDRRGSIMMSFMHSIGERKYDWDKRQKFALSATEVGSLITMDAQDSCDFFHDPSMLSSNAGQIAQCTHSLSLIISPSLAAVVNNLLNTKDYFSVPVTTAEFAVMKTACTFALPHIMGWDQITNQQSRGIDGLQAKGDSKVSELEWER
ncbi:hypothetical protein JHK85_008736 [Glycine max]|nr:hypothetical protein JHK85_008736 [Glycine max]KAG5073295.1 hypothetical protein JHK86_008506 [Glycine max]